MKHALKGLALVLFALAMVTPVWADDATQVKEAITAARQKLVTMVKADPAEYGHLKTDVTDASKHADDVLGAALAAGHHTDKLVEVKTTWEAFKATRDTELIPSLEGGHPDQAKALATGVQKERFEKMMHLLDEIHATH